MSAVLVSQVPSGFGNIESLLFVDIPLMGDADFLWFSQTELRKCGSSPGLFFPAWPRSPQNLLGLTNKLEHKSGVGQSSILVCRRIFGRSDRSKLLLARPAARGGLGRTRRSEKRRHQL